MSSNQYQDIVPPTPDDASLQDFTQVLQENIQNLFDQSHTHFNQTTAPGVNDGAVNDIIPVLLGSTTYLYVKFPDPVGWKRFGPGE